MTVSEAIDPDVCLQALRNMAAAIVQAVTEDRANTGMLAAHGVALAGIVQAMDEWMTAGGGMPKAWEVQRGASQ